MWQGQRWPDGGKYSPVCQGWPSSDRHWLWPPSSDSRPSLWFCFWRRQSSRTCEKKGISQGQLWNINVRLHAWCLANLHSCLHRPPTLISQWGRSAVCLRDNWPLYITATGLIQSSMTKKAALIELDPKQAPLWTFSPPLGHQALKTTGKTFSY